MKCYCYCYLRLCMSLQDIIVSFVLSTTLPCINILYVTHQELIEEWQTPQLMVNGINCDDIKQGNLGDCWFLSSCAAVSNGKDPKFMEKVIL